MCIIYFSNKSLFIQLSVSCLLYLFPISPCTLKHQSLVYYIFFQQLVPVHSTISVMFIIYFSNKSLYIKASESCLIYIFPTISPCTFNYQCHVYYICLQQVPVHSTIRVLFIIYFSNN